MGTRLTSRRCDIAPQRRVKPKARAPRRGSITVDTPRTTTTDHRPGGRATTGGLIANRLDTQTASSQVRRPCADESVCKPGPVQGSVAGLPCAAIHLRLPLPTASSGLPVSSGGPPSNAHAGPTRTPDPLDLAPGGVCIAAPVTWDAGGLLHHRFTLAPSAVSGREAVCSLLHCPAGHPGWVLPTTLPCGARTFLDDPGPRTVPPRPPDRLIRPPRLRGSGTAVETAARDGSVTPWGHNHDNQVPPEVLPRTRPAAYRGGVPNEARNDRLTDN